MPTPPNSTSLRRGWDDLDQTVLALFRTAATRSEAEVTWLLPDVPHEQLVGSLNVLTHLGLLTHALSTGAWRVTPAGLKQLTPDTINRPAA